MDQAYLRHVVLSCAQEVFSTMLGMDAQACEAANSVTGTEERVVALIGFAGTYLGNGMVGCSPRLACQAASGMMMAEYATIDSEVLDAVGEICNMIFGNVKTVLEAEAGPMGLSIPTVVFGRNFATHSPQHPWVPAPMMVGGELLDLRLTLSANSSARRHSPHGFRREYSLSEMQILAE